uniref:Calmodulin-like protein 3 n=1 Tax=Haliotis discus hannai TaxID=42344 RepID=A0A565DC68_HALDH|nr:calmodulin-like protein 3 [Haliotis discus hannai]
MLSATFFIGKLLQPYMQLNPDPPAPKPAQVIKPAAAPVTQAAPVQKTSQPKPTTLPKVVRAAPKVTTTPKMTEQWAQAQVEKYKFDFDEADKDKSGNLSYAEVKTVLENSGFCGTEAEAKKVFDGIDMTKDGKVTLVEYMAAIKKIPSSAMKEMALSRAFKIMDKDKSGFLTSDEVINATKTMAELNVSSESIAELLQALAKDADSKLDYEEFLAVFGIQLTAEIMRSAFRLLDSDGSGFITKDELIKSIQSDADLNIKAEKMSDLLIAWVKDDDKKINYEEFVKVWTQQKPVKK